MKVKVIPHAGYFLTFLLVHLDLKECLKIQNPASVKTEKSAQKLTTKEKKERARRLRIIYGYSYSQIAKELGIGKTTVYRWLNEGNDNGTKK